MPGKFKPQHSLSNSLSSFVSCYHKRQSSFSKMCPLSFPHLCILSGCAVFCNHHFLWLGSRFSSEFVFLWLPALGQTLSVKGELDGHLCHLHLKLADLFCSCTQEIRKYHKNLCEGYIVDYQVCASTSWLLSFVIISGFLP